LEFIRGGDKDTKKAVIFELAGQDGGVDGLVSILAEDELNGLILEFQDDPEFWSTLGIEPPPPPPGFGPGPIPPGGEFGPEGPFPPPVFVPPPEQLEFIRGGDKDTKKAVIFELAGQDGGVDGLVSILAEDELNGLILEFQDDPEFWSTLGIEPPPPPISGLPELPEIGDTSLAGEDAPLDTPLDGQQVDIDLVGVRSDEDII
jgi:U5 snRNP spliceosome subunit